MYSSSGKPQRQRPRTEDRLVSARDKFLSELSQYASDDDADASSLQRHASPMQDGCNDGKCSSSPTDAAPGQTVAPLPESLGFFAAAEAHSATHEKSKAHDAPVGLSLLRRMHKEVRSTSDTLPTPSTKMSSRQLQVVEVYVPMSSGGFLDTTDEPADIRRVRPGDVMCKRNAIHDAGVRTSVPAAGKSSGTSSVSSSIMSSPITGLPPPLSSGASPSDVLQRFTNATQMLGDEQRYGKRLTYDMVSQLFEVTRVDAAKQTLEALFLNGTKEKLSIYHVRPAGFVEREVYAQWKADPSSRPVPVIDVTKSSPAQSVTPTPAVSPTTTTPTTAEGVIRSTWWVIPHIVVRVVAEGAGSWYGKKCVVVSVQRASQRVRLREWLEQPSSSPQAAEIELVGVDALDTVIPKKGDRGIVVLGEHRGEVVVVQSRKRNSDGDLMVVEVQSTRTQDTFSLEPHELTELRRT